LFPPSFDFDPFSAICEDYVKDSLTCQEKEGDDFPDDFSFIPIVIRLFLSEPQAIRSRVPPLARDSWMREGRI
jgi:hypothetical protein